MFPLKVWMILTIGGVVGAVMEGNFEPNMLNTISLWRNLNWLTIATATVILTFHLLAILNFNNPGRTHERLS
jgi:hypothetical protein